MHLRALHLTGVVLVIALPWAGRAGAVDAGRVPGRSGRPWRHLAWLVSFRQSASVPNHDRNSPTDRG